jgi:hypothetical protein
METRQQEINAGVNLLVPSKMWNLHYIQKGGLREVHRPRLRDDFHLRSLCLGHIFVRHEHAIALTVSQVIVTDFQSQNPL